MTNLKVRETETIKSIDFDYIDTLPKTTVKRVDSKYRNSFSYEDFNNAIILTNKTSDEQAASLRVSQGLPTGTETGLKVLECGFIRRYDTNKLEQGKASIIRINCRYTSKGGKVKTAFHYAVVVELESWQSSHITWIARTREQAETFLSTYYKNVTLSNELSLNTSKLYDYNKIMTGCKSHIKHVSNQ